MSYKTSHIELNVPNKVLGVNVTSVTGETQWAHANGCPWNESTCAYAAEGGHLFVLQWARANGCPLDEWTYHFALEEGHHEC